MVQSGPRRLTAWVAIVVIAMQSLLLGFASHAPVAAGFDPIAVICHSDGSSGTADTQAPSPDTPGDCCSQCILATNFSTGSPPVIAIDIPHARATDILPVVRSSLTVTSSAAATGHRPRAPPVLG
jgi:hypothetical protein